MLPDYMSNYIVAPQIKGGAPSNKHVPGEVGIWLFVAGDLVVFSVFFVVIALGNVNQPDLFQQSRDALDMWVGVLNTGLLLTGSWFVARGVEESRLLSGPRTGRYFTWGILCGLGFIANKSFEWGGKISAGLSPATNDFYMLFFVFTGIHLLHVIVGIVVLLVIRNASRRKGLGAKDIQTIESGATFWHLVDLLWIALFALLYLL
ncbi:cytochrome c oxidase subunit III [Alteromonas sp. I4]|nr:cytochrome c oxidase subunit III [Alteromonas sp. I4]